MVHTYKIEIDANGFLFSGIAGSFHISHHIYYHLIGCTSEAMVLTRANIYRVLILINAHNHLSFSR